MILSAAVGTDMSTVAGRNSFMGGSKVFMYFTIQSNIAIAIICAFGGLLLVLLIAVGWCYMAIADRIGKRKAVRMLETVIPGLEDLWFRERLLADEETMSYNHAWGGTVPFPEEKWQKWYDHWIVHPDDQRYYRYLKDENGFVGEIAYRYDPGYDGYVANIIIFSAFRGKGYGAEGLELLCAAAKENGITLLYDDIAVDNPAVRLFLRHGFYEDHRTEEKIVLKKDL